MSYEEQLPLPSAPIPDIGEIVADAPAVPAQADDDAATVERILTASATDPTAYLAKESLDAFRRIRESDSVEYERVRTLLKSANPKIRVTKLDELTQARMMELVVERLGGSTLLHVAHRPGLEKYHNRKIVLERADNGAAIISETAGRPGGRGLGRLFGRVFARRPAGDRTAA